MASYSFANSNKQEPGQTKELFLMLSGNYGFPENSVSCGRPDYALVHLLRLCQPIYASSVITIFSKGSSQSHPVWRHFSCQPWLNDSLCHWAFPFPSAILGFALLARLPAAQFWTHSAHQCGSEARTHIPFPAHPQRASTFPEIRTRMKFNVQLQSWRVATKLNYSSITCSFT